MLVTVNPVPGAYYNIGGNHSCTVGEILNTLLSFSPLQKDIAVEVDPDRLRPIDADLQVPNTAKFYAHTGWKAEIPYEKTLRDLLDYWRERVRAGGRFLSR
jgi:GDPmannose 4,6-dehydratase